MFTKLYRLLVVPSLFLIISLFTIRTNAAGSSSSNLADDMYTASALDQASKFSSSNLKWKNLGPYPSTSIPPNFQSSAWDLARTHGVQPLPLAQKSRNFGFAKKPKGEGEKWFYSIVKPETELGRNMGLMDGSRKGKNSAASVLWKYNQREGRGEVVRVDKVRDRGFEWNLERLEDVIRHH